MRECDALKFLLAAILWSFLWSFLVAIVAVNMTSSRERRDHYRLVRREQARLMREQLAADDERPTMTAFDEPDRIHYHLDNTDGLRHACLLRHD